MVHNKKGQELSTNTVIILVLAVLVLVFIIIGFSVGWNRIFPFISPPNNVKDISDKCGLACSTEDTYGFCTSKRDVKLEDDITGVSTDKKIQGTCNDLAAVKELGIRTCSISCDMYSSQVFAQKACDRDKDSFSGTKPYAYSGGSVSCVGTRAAS